jgi:hypothetical protein
VVDVWGLVSIVLILTTVLGTKHLVQKMVRQESTTGDDPPGRRVRDMTALGKACLGALGVALAGLVVGRATDAPWTGWCALAAVVLAGAGMIEEARRLRRAGLPLVPRDPAASSRDGAAPPRSGVR